MKKTILLASCALVLASCQNYLDVNEDPNKPTNAPVKILLPTTTIGMAWASGNELGRAAGVLVQYNAGLANSALNYDNYLLPGLLNNQWDYEIYNGTVNNLIKIIGASEATSPAYSGIAKIELAYTMAMATDLWGDVPYSQAGRGLEYPQPRYDSQKDIYLGNSSAGIQSLFDLVKSGIADLDKPSTLKPSTDDLAYGGDLAKWKKAANTLLLKLAIQLTNVDKTKATAIINEVIASSNGFIDNNASDLEVKFGSAIGNQNPYYQQDISGSFKNNQMLSTRFLTLARSLNDTVRLAKYYTKPIPSGKTIPQFVSYDNGANVTAPAVGFRSMYNTYVVGTAGEAPVRLLTNFQSQFILAEAVVTLGVSTGKTANEHYQAGIKASMAKVGMSIDEINQYFTDNPAIVNLSGTPDNQLQQIITQKYMSWVGNGIEAYNDYRRTGYPKLQVSLNAGGDNPSVVPLRLAYTDNEGNANPNQPKPRPKTDEKVWWGK